MASVTTYFHSYCKQLRQCEKQWTANPNVTSLSRKVERIQEIVAGAKNADLSYLNCPGQYHEPLYKQICEELTHFEKNTPSTMQELTAFLKRINGFSRRLIPLERVYEAWEYEVDLGSHIPKLFLQNQDHKQPERFLKKVLRHPDFESLSAARVYTLLMYSIEFPFAHEALLRHPKFEKLQSGQIYYLLQKAAKYNAKTILDHALRHPICVDLTDEEKLEIVRNALRNDAHDLNTPWIAAWFPYQELNAETVYQLMETSICSYRSSVISSLLEHPAVKEMTPRNIVRLKQICEKEHACPQVLNAMNQLITEKRIDPKVGYLQMGDRVVTVTVQRSNK